jgi:SAM-dependent methyltransferase
MFDRLKASIRAQAFHPGLLGLLINPFYFARKGLHQHIVALAPSVRGRLLDVGCGSKPYQRYFEASEYIGLDIEGRNRHADRSYDGKVFPFNDGEFDAVLTSEALEHVFNPDEFLSEINRVLRDGGVLLLTVPFVWDEHEQPFDYARYSSFGLRHLLERHGFEIIEHRKTMDDIRVIFQLVNAYIYKKTAAGSWRMNLLIMVILMAPFNVLGELFAKILPSNSDLYLDNIILACKAKGSGFQPSPQMER